jgi:hypothetical protein
MAFFLQACCESLKMFYSNSLLLFSNIMKHAMPQSEVTFLDAYDDLFFKFVKKMESNNNFLPLKNESFVGKFIGY